MAGVIYLTVGVSGSGKSTFAQFFCKATGCAEINKDTIRKTLSRNIAWDKKLEQKIKGVVKSMIIAKLATGTDVFLSNTNLKSTDLTDLRSQFPGNKIIVFVMKDSEDVALCIERVTKDLQEGKDRSPTNQEIIESQFREFQTQLEFLKHCNLPNIEINTIHSNFVIQHWE